MLRFGCAFCILVVVASLGLNAANHLHFIPALLGVLFGTMGAMGFAALEVGGNK
jgi:hypothetical protein